MSRLMIDVTHANARKVATEEPTPALIALYRTGSADIEDTKADAALWPHATQVWIDQGGNGSPVPTADVRDVEPGAWSAHDAVHNLNWTADRKTIYCDRSDLSAVIAEGWTGDVWLAWPGFAGTVAPSFPPVHIVAVQNVFLADHDRSIVFDAAWPLKEPVTPPPPEFSITIGSRVCAASIPVIPNADHYVMVYVAVGAGTELVLGRWPQPKTGTVIHASPITIPGSHGGQVSTYGIVHSKRVSLGTHILP